MIPYEARSGIINDHGHQLMMLPLDKKRLKTTDKAKYSIALLQTGLNLEDLKWPPPDMYGSENQ